MRTIKLIDTCTLINLVCEQGMDLSGLCSKYDLYTTSSVIKEYTIKIPRQIPPGITVISETPIHEKTMDTIHNIIPRLGDGERSIIAVGMGLIDDDTRVVLITDDLIAKKKIHNSIAIHKSYPCLSKVIWGDKDDLVDRILSMESE